MTQEQFDILVAMIEAMLEHAEYGDLTSGAKKRKAIEEARKALVGGGKAR